MSSKNNKAKHTYNRIQNEVSPFIKDCIPKINDNEEKRIINFVIDSSKNYEITESIYNGTELKKYLSNLKKLYDDTNCTNDPVKCRRINNNITIFKDRIIFNSYQLIYLYKQIFINNITELLKTYYNEHKFFIPKEIYKTIYEIKVKTNVILEKNYYYYYYYIKHKNIKNLLNKLVQNLHNNDIEINIEYISAVFTMLNTREIDKIRGIISHLNEDSQTNNINLNLEETEMFQPKTSSNTNNVYKKGDYSVLGNSKDYINITEEDTITTPNTVTSKPTSNIVIETGFGFEKKPKQVLPQNETEFGFN
jgi:hypothetical protein